MRHLETRSSGPRRILVDPRRFELRFRDCQPRVLPLDDEPVVQPPGNAPDPPAFQTSVLLLHQSCMKIGCQGRSRTCGHLFQRQGSVPTQSAWQWRSLRESNPFFYRDKVACARHTQEPNGRPERNCTSDCDFGDRRDADFTTDLWTGWRDLHSRLSIGNAVLCYLSYTRMDRPTGIAPASPRWKRDALLLSYGRMVEAPVSPTRCVC